MNIDPKHAGEFFVAVLLDDFQTCGLALSGSAEAKEYERGKWSVSAQVLNAAGTTERRVLSESFPSGSEARVLVDFINGPAETHVVN
jgi:hypothetical protein